MKTRVTCMVNGDETEMLVDDDETLLTTLRDVLHLVGVKEGCGTGDCGACSVLLDDRLVCSCLVFAAEIEGKEVRTVEGMALSGSLHPLQQHFLTGAALQCGICTPGFLIAAKALLDQNPNPTEQQVRYAIAGNLCRCTGYDKIVRAILDTAEEMREEVR
ncbi:MAG: (2Fe-2S)-binding protein [Acidimicrobiia bacterium]